MDGKTLAIFAFMLVTASAHYTTQENYTQSEIYTAPTRATNVSESTNSTCDNLEQEMRNKTSNESAFDLIMQANRDVGE